MLPERLKRSGLWCAVACCALLLPAGSALGQGSSELQPVLESGQLEENLKDERAEWSALSPGKGFRLVETQYGELNVSAYLLMRYLNQLPVDQTFRDHLGDERDVDTRHEIQLQRVLLFISGFVFSEKLRYEVLIWAVNSPARLAVVGEIGYLLNDAFQLYAGVNGLPGTRSMTGAFPFFFGTDRQLADEFFRPGFTGGIWATGELFDMLGYRAMLGNNLSQIYADARRLTRDFATSASVWIMPTTGEFGPRGGFGDYEMHERVATRFGSSITRSREDRFSQFASPTPEHTQLRLSDSVLLFEPGALAPGATVTRADYYLVAFDAGLKYRGLHVQTEYYLRWITRLRADGDLPLGRMFDHGLSLQVGYQVWPRRTELYLVTSQVFGRFGNSYEGGGGMNVYPLATRNFRLNATALYVHRSAASSPFGYYVGGQTGPVLSIAADLLF